MAAEALEQSVLESKDKDQLLAIAKALGLKASARTKKSDIIDQILETTGSPTARANGAPVVPATALEDRAATVTSPRSRHHRPTSRRPRSSRPTCEPPAEWELEVGTGDDRPDSAGRRGRLGQRRLRPPTSPAATTATAAANEGLVSRPADATAAASGDGGTPGAPGRPGNANAGRRRTAVRVPEARRARAGTAGGVAAARAAPAGPRARRATTSTVLERDGEVVSNEPVEVSGYLDMRDEGYGFLRVKGYLPSRDDSYIPVKLARQYGLRKGDHVTGLSRPAGRNEKNPALLEINTVNGGDPEAAKKRPRFEDLTALFPDEKLRLEDPADPTNMTARIIDLISPIGKGQRGLIVSPPKAGKTFVVKTIAKSIELNNPEVKLIVLLVDERPEEVTDMRRNVRGEVISSTFDRPSDEHTHVAELAIEKAKRLVEQGEDVVVVLDGITRLSRAYNLAAPASGRILSGGIDAGALYPPKKFFGAARNVEEGGSLTILATALVETNSRMDEAIFEEFKGTGNMELRLDRKLAERRIYPAIDVDASSTRHEELLFDRKQLQMVWKLRRVLSGLAADGNAAPGLELLIDRLKTFRTNDEFLNEIAKQPSM